MNSRAAILCGLLFSAGWLAGEDLDRDGLDDGLEQRLLEQFRPFFIVSSKDCDGRPAAFRPGNHNPEVAARDGTIYGQAFRLPEGRVELHFFHLWGRDCGRVAHPLDIEHVSARLELRDGRWRATHWFAAAHQGTPCDLGQGASAETLQAFDRGIHVYVSMGKHASFLSREACRKGCGGDRCEEPMGPLPAGPLINLGEWGAPVNGADWIASRQWEFESKLRTDFDDFALRQIAKSPGRIAIFRPTLVPVRATIRGFNEGADGLAIADEKTGDALDTAENHTSRALEKSYESTKGAIRKSAQAAGGFLGIGKKKQK